MYNIELGKDFEMTFKNVDDKKFVESILFELPRGEFLSDSANKISLSEKMAARIIALVFCMHGSEFTEGNDFKISVYSNDDETNINHKFYLNNHVIDVMKDIRDLELVSPNKSLHELFNMTDDQITEYVDGNLDYEFVKSSEKSMKFSLPSGQEKKIQIF